MGGDSSDGSTPADGTVTATTSGGSPAVTGVPAPAPILPLPTDTTDSSRGQQTEAKPLRVLVVGDWLFDDFWATTRSSTATASFAGYGHLVSANTTGDSVCEAGGAGRIATLMKTVVDARSGTPAKLDTVVVGMGVWHNKDDDAVATATFDPLSIAGETPHQLTKSRSSEKWKPPDYKNRGCGLINIGHALVKVGVKPAGGEGIVSERDMVFGTSRIFRVYQWTGSGLRLVNRIDWSISPAGASGQAKTQHSRQRAWLMKEGQELWEANLDTQMEAIRGMYGDDFKFDIVAIKDMDKGVVSSELIAWMARNTLTKGAAYYVSSRRWQPAWFKTLTAQKLDTRLIFFLEDALRSCSDVPTWISSKGKLAPDAAQKLIHLGDEFCKSSPRPGSRLVIGGLVRRLQSIGFDTRGEQKTICWQANPLYTDDNTWNVGVGNSSVFFTALMLGLRHADDDPNYSVPLSQLYDSATRVAREWITRQTDELVPSRTPAARKEFILAYTYSTTVVPQPSDGSRLRIGRATKVAQDAQGKAVYQVNALAAQTVLIDTKSHAHRIETEIRDELGDAEVALGVIRRARKDGTKEAYYRIEPWRAYLEVEGYVCCDPSKRRRISQLRDALDRFHPSATSRATTGIVIASPGTGKTNLIRSLAEQQSMEFLSFNVTTMIRREDVLSSFDQIVTTQARSTSRPLLVFFDEINAMIDSQHVYDMFLAPLEDGYYVRNGMRFLIRPCVWLFAGTRTPGYAADGSRAGDDSKASDFMSRMTLGKIDITDHVSTNTEQHGIKLNTRYKELENVYLGLALLRARYPDTQSVRRSILVAFELLQPDVAPRKLRRFIDENVESHQGRCSWRLTSGLLESLYSNSHMFHRMPTYLFDGINSDSVDVWVEVDRK